MWKAKLKSIDTSDNTITIEFHDGSKSFIGIYNIESTDTKNSLVSRIKDRVKDLNDTKTVVSALAVDLAGSINIDIA